jgi:hypothetical protein
VLVVVVVPMIWPLRTPTPGPSPAERERGVSSVDRPVPVAVLISR